MPERSKRIQFHDADKVSRINPENLKLLQKYNIIKEDRSRISKLKDQFDI